MIQGSLAEEQKTTRIVGHELLGEVVRRRSGMTVQEFAAKWLWRWTMPCRRSSARASAILRTDIAEAATPAMEAAVRAGFRVVEFTLTTPGAFELIADLSVNTGKWMRGTSERLQTWIHSNTPTAAVDRGLSGAKGATRQTQSKRTTSAFRHSANSHDPSTPPSTAPQTEMPPSASARMSPGLSR